MPDKDTEARAEAQPQALRRARQALRSAMDTSDDARRRLLNAEQVCAERRTELRQAELHEHAAFEELVSAVALARRSEGPRS